MGRNAPVFFFFLYAKHVVLDNTCAFIFSLKSGCFVRQMVWGSMILPSK